MRQLKINLDKCNGGHNCNHECEIECATRVFKINDTSYAAIDIVSSTNNQNITRICDQCGDCAAICPTDALQRNKLGVVTLNKKHCVGCYMCVGFCEKNIFKRDPSNLTPHKCTACGICVSVCPNKALEIIDVPIPAQRII